MNSNQFQNLLNPELPLGQLYPILKNFCTPYIVGGTVRDLLLGLDAKDLDLAVDVKPDVILEELKVAGFRVIPTGITHGTVTVAIDKSNVEITSFRSPSTRNGTLYSETIEQDLLGRDFTINALAWDIKNQKLIDPFLGLSDLEAKIVKAVDDPELRFREDPLRILRMVRFGPANKFTLDTRTSLAAASLADLLKNVSVERIRDELIKILIGPDPSSGVRALYTHGLLPYTIPEVLPSIGCEQNKWHVEDVFEHTLTVISRTESRDILRFAALFHDLGKPHTVTVGEDGERHFYQHEYVSTQLCKQALKRLKFPNEFIQQVAKLTEYHMRPLQCSDSTVRRLMRDLGPLLDEWREFKWADKSPSQPEETFQAEATCFDAKLNAERMRLDYQERTKLAINGNLIMSHLNLEPGPNLGDIIKYLKEVILDYPNKNNESDLLAIAKKYNEQTNHPK